MCIVLGVFHYESQKIKYMDILDLWVTEIYLWSAECYWHAYFLFSAPWTKSQICNFSKSDYNLMLLAPSHPVSPEVPFDEKELLWSCQVLA